MKLTRDWFKTFAALAGHECDLSVTQVLMGDGIAARVARGRLRHTLERLGYQDLEELLPERRLHPSTEPLRYVLRVEGEAGVRAEEFLDFLEEVERVLFESGQRLTASAEALNTARQEIYIWRTRLVGRSAGKDA